MDNWIPALVVVPDGLPSPLATSQELMDHLDASPGDWNPEVVADKLKAATSYIAGPEGLTGRLYEAASLEAHYYLPAGRRLVLLGGTPNLRQYPVALRQDVDGNQVGEPLTVDVRHVGHRWYLELPYTPRMEEGQWVRATYSILAQPVPLVVKEACLKLAAHLVENRVGPRSVGMSLAGIRELLAGHVALGR